MKNYFLLNVILSILWVMLTGDLSFYNGGLGFVLGFLIVWMISYENNNLRYVKLVPRVIGFFGYFVYQLVKASIEVAYEVATPNLYMKPGIIRIPLDAKTDLEITLLANAVAITPGSLSLDVSEDKKYLYVHAMYVKDKQKYIRSVKNGFEKKILNILQ